MRMPFVFRHEAMNTEWELVVVPDDGREALARSAARAVFDEVDRLEEELSRFKSTSDIWRLSMLKADESTTVNFATWDCLSLAKAVHAETNGAFDVTLGPMMRLWRHSDGSQRVPFPEEVANARQRVGMHLFDLVEDGMRFVAHAADLRLDLGALGKGYALDQAVRVLEEQGISSAFLSAGESSLVTIGSAPDDVEGWPVDLHLDPPQTLRLQGDALSCSGFAVQGAHIMDPRRFEPLPVSPRRSYVLAPTAALSDALSTAFMVMSDEEVRAFCARHAQVKWLSGPAA